MLIDIHQVKCLLQKKITGILHVGAHECEEKHAYNTVLNIEDSQIVWVDANDRLTQQNKLKGIPNCYTAVLDETERTTTFNITNNGQSSSILDFGTHETNYEWCKVIEKKEVKTQTLTNFFLRNNLDPKQYNFWNFDIQGVELQVFRGSEDLLQYADIIYTEVNTEEVYKQCGQLHEIDSLLEKHGLKRIALKMTSEGWGDAIYMRSYKPPVNSFQADGRLCNHLFRNAVVSELCKKNNLFFEYSYSKELSKLGIPLFVGTQKYDETLLLTNENILELMNTKLEKNILFLHKDIYFQTREISHFLYNYLHSIKELIIQNNSFKKRYQKNNDCFIHVRLGDVPHYNPGIQYYLKVLENIEYDTVYITSDSPNHQIVNDLLKCPRSKLLSLVETTTLQFGSTCKHIILSHGSFSAILGYLGFYSQIYYPSFENMEKWHGDIFSIPRWKCY
jgi:FkbM family methyltransferase